MTSSVCHFAIPGALDSPTGGYGYDRALLAHLPAQGWAARHLPLPGGFPFATPSDLDAAEAALADLPEGAVVMVDGLAFGAMPGVAARQGARLRLVALVHHPLADEGGQDAATTARQMAEERAALACARAVICTSPTTARRLVAGFGVPPDRLTVAVPGTAPGAQAAGSQDGVPLVLSVGSLIRRKGHDLLVAALAGLTDLPWRLRIAGAALEPDTAAALACQVRDSGLQDRVTLAGSLPDIRAEYLRADLFALATWHEGYGMAFAEALSHGLPIVATRAGAVPDVVPEAAGRLVPPGDLVALRTALADLLGDPQARAQAAAAARAAGRALPDWPATAARVAAVLAQVAR